MPRRGSSFGGSSRTSSPKRNTTTAQAPPRQPAPQVHSPPVQAQPQGGIMSGMAGTFMTGMALGAGSEVAHQTIRGLMGGSSHQQAAPQENIQQAQSQQNMRRPECDSENQRFVQCLKDYSDIGMCQNYMDMFKECQKKYGL